MYTLIISAQFSRSQRYLFNSIPDTNHNANPNRNSKGNRNPTKLTLTISLSLYENIYHAFIEGL